MSWHHFNNSQSQQVSLQSAARSYRVNDLKPDLTYSIIIKAKMSIMVLENDVNVTSIAIRNYQSGKI